MVKKTSSSAEEIIKSIHDITMQHREIYDISLDNIDRDLHEPNIIEIIKFYKLSPDDFK